MPYHGIEHRELDPVADLPDIGVMGHLLLTHSWRWGYEKFVHPVDEIRKADLIIGSFIGARMVGCCVVNRLADPRPGGPLNGQNWLSCWLVVPRLRRRGIGRELYDMCFQHMAKAPQRLLLSTENRDMHSFFGARGWTIIDEASVNEAGDPTVVFEYIRP